MLLYICRQIVTSTNSRNLKSLVASITISCKKLLGISGILGNDLPKTMLSGGFPIYFIVDASEDGDNPMPQLVFINLYDGVLISKPATSSVAQQGQYCGNKLYSTERKVHPLGIQYTVVLHTQYSLRELLAPANISDFENFLMM